MYVAFCTFNIRYTVTNPWQPGLYIVRTRLYDWKRVHKCINMYIHVWTMYVHVHTTTCTYHVHTMYIHVYTFTEMYIHVCTCLCFSIIVYTMSVSRCTLALYIHCTYMVQTCLYTFMPGGQDSRWHILHIAIGKYEPRACTIFFAYFQVIAYFAYFFLHTAAYHLTNSTYFAYCNRQNMQNMNPALHYFFLHWYYVSYFAYYFAYICINSKPRNQYAE
jgi:hypothetical protein